ncbi:MAG TPA: fumarylacetoacetate hydrolase family protein [Candidatus Eisenbacteria bacterium]
MRFVSFARAGAPGHALGVLDGDSVLHVANAAAVLGVPDAERAALATMETLLVDWDRGRALARTVVERAAAFPPGERVAPLLARTKIPVQALTLHPPVAHPPSIRDFYAFEGHVKTARSRRGLAVPPEWYEFPVFYFSNPGALVGPGAPVPKPSFTEALDYELEIACVIGKRARNVAPDAWREVVAGFTILNDWSARDVQRREMAVGLGPAKGKDFATSLGPAVVTLDELESRRRGERFDLAMEARVNGGVLSRGNVSDLHWTFGQMIARASEDVYLFPGDVIGSGTVGTGCILELGTDVHRWLLPGDEVTLEIDLLGSLTNTIT